ncbi:MAG: SH3 domain-containing protein [Flavobacteriaceae bacterium]
MKKVVLIFASVVFTFTFLSCKGDKPSPTTKTSSVEALNPESTIAMADPSEIHNEKSVEYRYVTAPSGLSLREYNNLQSEKLGKMPYGTKVKVLHAEGKNTMDVMGIKGAMDEVEFNHKTGFAFNGYLSKYFPPEQDMTAKGYAGELQKQFPSVTFTETVEGTASNPITIETLVLPEVPWHEAFGTAQRLMNIPSEFVFPNPKGKDSEIQFDGKPKKGIWISQLEISRKDNELQKIDYVYTSQKFNSKVSIEKEGDVMKITRTEEVK